MRGGDRGEKPRGRASDAAPSTEPVWTFRGYELKPSEFTAAMVHLFRAEVNRANVWRSRLDTTTNWAVLTTGAALSFAFSQESGSHLVIILNALLVTLFLYIEARRYRYYELWSTRVRLMETDFFAAMLVPPFRPAPDWAESLAENLLQPHFTISMWEAFGRRLRNNFAWIFAVLGLSWIFKVWLHPTGAASWQDFLARASLGAIPGWLVVLAGAGFNGALALIALLTFGMHAATGEVLPRFSGQPTPGLRGRARRAWFRAAARREQFLTLIVTDRASDVAQRILQDMQRGVTALPGVGMYTHKPHQVLMCALTSTELTQLKAMLHEQDPGAFVVVSPAAEILGKGFWPIEEETGE